ncbi:MAG: extracellular solute-binding protein [Clostridiales bacterium]|nr:extracellular solute-binding protein [Clostridiales bacterium]
MTKRLLAILLAALMLITLFAACSSDKKTDESSSETKTEEKKEETKKEETKKEEPKKEEPKKEEPKKEEASSGAAYELNELGQLPLVKSGEAVLSIGFPQSPSVTDYEDNYLTDFLEERGGFEIEFVFFPTSGTEARQKLELMISSNQELPDIVTSIGVGSIGKQTYGQQGVFLELDEWLETETFWFPQAKERWLTEQEKKDIVTFYKSTDGHTYGFPYVTCDPTDNVSRCLWINKPWLDTLGLDVPKTTDEFFDVLVAFRDKDPNGNGINDEIPFTGANTWVSDPVEVLMNAFIYYSPYRLNVENGVVSVPYVEEAYRDGLRWMNSMFKENLFDASSFTMDGSQHKAIFDLPDDQISYCGSFAGHPYTKFAIDNPHRTEYIHAFPLEGPNGVAYAPTEVTGYGYSCFITKYAEDPLLAFRFLDSQCDPEAAITVRWGAEGVNWEWAEEGETTRLAPLGYKAVFKELEIIWGTENNTIWNANPFNFAPAAVYAGTVAKPQEDFTSEAAYLGEIIYHNSIFDLVKPECTPDETVTIMVYTAEEDALITEIGTPILEYERECRAAFVTGTMDIEKDWDSYIDTLYSMGLEDYIATVQQCYDRMYK